MSTGSLKRLKERIASVHSTKKITEVMKLMSSSKLKKSKDILNNAKPFFNKINYVIAKSDIFDIAPPLHKQYIEKIHNLVIVVSSSRSLCGNYNSIVFRRLQTLLEDDKITFLPIGSKVINFLQKNVSGERIIHPIDNNQMTYTQVKGLINYILSLKKFSTIKILHNELVKSSAACKNG